MVLVKSGVIVMLSVGLASAKPINRVNSVPAVPQSAPAAGTGTGWREYDDLMRRRGEVQQDLLTRHQEIMQQYGRNDVPEAVAVLAPIRKELQAIDAQVKSMLECEGERVADPRAIFSALKIKTNKLGVADRASLRAYLESRVLDGTLTRAQYDRFILIVNLRTQNVMNPASRGASQIAAALAGTLRCFAIDTPAASKTVRPATEPLLVAKQYATTARVSFYSYRVKHIGNTQGHFAPILVLPDGGSLIVGTKSDTPPGGKYTIGKSHAVAIRLDARGKRVWEKKFDKKGFRDYEGGGAAQTADGGFIVFALSYVHPARSAVSRFVKLDAKGKLVWERQLRGDGSLNSPFPSQLVQLMPNGSIALFGHVYTDAKYRAASPWQGEIDSSGKLVIDKAGPPQGAGGGGMFGGAGYGGSTYGGSMYGGSMGGSMYGGALGRGSFAR